MLKKIIRLLSRKTIAEEPLVDAVTTAAGECERIVDLISYYLRVPHNPEEERRMSVLASAALGEDALSLLPSINSKLSSSGWEVVWLQGRVTFIYVSARKQRYLELLDEIADVSSKRCCRATEMYLTGICTAFIELDSWLQERLDPASGDTMLDAEDALRAAFARGWTFKLLSNASGHRLFCSAEAPHHSDRSAQWPETTAAVARTIH
ncbi:hypothetical protein V6R85_24000 [Agrobacterium sp. CCNWLW32]|uniref:hypothetical protein n=1 Tax=Agrobacterium sp. CCNWLW32 TaxID=3122072 RepID=UPI0030103720